MDLRRLIKSEHQVDAARRLALRGLLSYQPYIFSDAFAVGAGPSIFAGHDKADQHAISIFSDAVPMMPIRSFVLASSRRTSSSGFFAANEAMRSFYDGLVDQIADALGPINDLSVLDVGCNTGYFPLAFARGEPPGKGHRPHRLCAEVALLNEICGTSVQFEPWDYDGSLIAPNSMTWFCRLPFWCI